MPDMTPVSSSNIAAVGYDEETNVLTVEFQSGASWNYTGVPISTYRALLTADSAGRYFAQNVRNAFPGSRA
jgi:hypothetical protein